MPFSNSLTELLSIRFPIMQAPIGSCSCPELAAAVSNAGGSGHDGVLVGQPGELPPQNRIHSSADQSAVRNQSGIGMGPDRASANLP